MFQIIYTLKNDVYTKHHKTFTSNRSIVEWLRDNNHVIDFYDYI